MSHELWVLAHILVIAYWLGTDLAVYYISGAIVDETKPTSVRVYAAKAMLLLDMVPRTALILTLLTGLGLATRGWLPHPAVGWWWLWPALLAWLALTWAVFHLEHSPLGAFLAKVDFGLRILIILTLLITTLALSLGWGQFAVLPWLAAKLGIMALIMFLGLVIRVQLKPFGPLFARVAQGNSDPTTERNLRRLIAQVKVPVWVIWISLVLAAAMGKLQPGM
ncbi:MAG: hypothetical protein EA370_06355 [Wenzhouxiangella sp.]|nr:MAG: hypothetical protein EA370_06355 [Wenzhouxiangella sp.]